MKEYTGYVDDLNNKIYVGSTVMVAETIDNGRLVCLKAKPKVIKKNDHNGKAEYFFSGEYSGEISDYAHCGSNYAVGVVMTRTLGNVCEVVK